MKKSISVLLCCCLIFASTVQSHAAWSDSQAASVVSDVSSIKTTLTNIYTRLGTIMGYLTDSGHSVAYWTGAISSWMQPIYNAIISMPSVTDFEHIIGGLNLVTGDSSSGYTYTPYLYFNNKSNANWLSDLHSLFDGTQNSLTHPAVAMFASNYIMELRVPDNNGSIVSYNINTASRTTLQLLAYLLINLNNNQTGIYQYQYRYLANGFNSTQNAVNWGNLGTSSFTPTSLINGIYSWLSAIQAPVARLSYVLASQERIEAQQAAALNEEAVVDNFIDSQGSGSASVSDYTAIAGLSSGFSSNVSTDASPSGFWDIFNSSHGSWFSQETYNQLDTTVQTRNSNFETPLLNQQIDDIYNIIGGNEER